METNFNSFFAQWQVKSAHKEKKLIQRDLFQTIADLSKTTRRILNYFCWMAQRLGYRSMYMSQSHIARVVGCTREWVNKCIKLLAFLGLIRSKNRCKYMDYKTNVYSVCFNFYKPEICHDLYIHLSSLRDLEKKFTQLRKVECNNYSGMSNKETMDKKVEQKTVPEPPVFDIMNMTLSQLRELQSKTQRSEPLQVNKPIVRPRGGGFKRIGDL